MVNSVLKYVDPSVQLAGVQYEYNHKKTGYGTYTIRNIQYIEPGSGQLGISCLICTVPSTGVTGWTGVRQIDRYVDSQIDRQTKDINM